MPARIKASAQTFATLKKIALPRAARCSLPARGFYRKFACGFPSSGYPPCDISQDRSLDCQFLTACVVDNTVAVIPGPAEVCAQLGIPTLDEK